MSAPDPLPLTVPDALTWIADLFSEPLSRVQVATARKDLAGWDSMGQLILMAGLDERFNIRLTDAELTRLTSIADILAILRQHGFIGRG